MSSSHATGEAGSDAGSFDTGLRPADVGRPRPIETPWGSFAVFAVEGRFVAAQSFCPHMQGPLFQGTRSGDEITCPWHRWRFSLVTGELLDGQGERTAAEHALWMCDVTIGARGTLVLGRPRRRV
jgi:nitrite reductase/ring-hydroxylating ferredoxin subunit